jgi:phosphopantothenoylcysteine decarboxylase/phosphopantothenate--cysteine ligase
LNFKGKTIAVMVTGGIAAYKACDIVSSLCKTGADVHVVMTQSAKQFVSPLTFETLSKNRVVSALFDTEREWEVEHISLAKKCDAYLLAPCTANVIGKIAAGIADDFLSTTVMAFTGPIIIAPAMNTNMYCSPAYKANAETLKNRGFYFVEPQIGMLACGDTGAGKLADTNQIVSFLAQVLQPKNDLEGKKVVVTTGGTRENIDPVRFLGNRSSGKMGIAIAKAAAERGADVTLVAGFISQETDNSYQTIKVETTQQMLLAVAEQKEVDYYIFAAAPADYRPKILSKTKLKEEKLTLELVKNPDIAAEIGKNKGNSKTIIFAAETDNHLENARKKLVKKNADMAILNDVTRKDAGFDVDTNIVTILKQNQTKEYPLMQKSMLAHTILDEMLCLQR